MSTTKITKAQFVKNYKEAEKRATPSATGVSFDITDRIALNEQRKQLGMDYSMAANLVGDNKSGKSYNRFALWERQVETGQIRTAHPATGEYVGSKQTTALQAFDGRIKSRADVQPAFNRAAVQLIKLGITNPRDAEAYLEAGFEYARVEQKIHLKTERIVSELRIGDLSRDQAVRVLDQVKASL